VHRLAKAQESKVFAWSSFEKGLVASRQILQRGATPAVLRLYDSIESSRNFSLGYGSEIPPGSCLMIVIDEGDAEIVQATMGIVTQECHEAVGMNTSLADHWLQHRNDVSILDTLLEAGVVVDTVEIAAKWIQLPSIYSEILDKLSGLDGILVASAHQSHAYTDGACLYFTFGGQEPSPRQVSSVPLIKPSNIQWANHFYKTAWESIMDTVIQHQGAISHHHGIGLLRAPWLAKSLGNSMEVLATLKKSLDPNGILNPGKLGLSSSFGDEVDLPLPFGKIYPRS
jgi:alkyldihydroxyacetonephosphate synthase